VEGLGTTKHCRHSLYCCSDNIVVGVLHTIKKQENKINLKPSVSMVRFMRQVSVKVGETNQLYKNILQPTVKHHLHVTKSLKI